MIISKQPVSPIWFSSLSMIGQQVAQQPNRVEGEEFPVVVLSVPTGQFVVWALFDGAVSATSKIKKVSAREPLLCTTWSDEQKQVADVMVLEKELEDGLATVIGTTTHTKGFPFVELPEGVPARSGRVLERKESESLKNFFRTEGLATPSKPWYKCWAEHCLSPIVVIGEGQKFLFDQLDLLRSEPVSEGWLSPLSLALTSIESQKVVGPTDVLRVPISVLSSKASRAHSWIQNLRPRLVIYTRWSYFQRRPPAAFSGVPTIVISNRRVDSSLDCARDTEMLRKKFPDWISTTINLPRGLSARYLEYPVITFTSSQDSEFGEDDEDEDF